MQLGRFRLLSCGCEEIWVSSSVDRQGIDTSPMVPEIDTLIVRLFLIGRENKYAFATAACSILLRENQIPRRPPLSYASAACSDVGGSSKVPEGHDSCSGPTALLGFLDLTIDVTRAQVDTICAHLWSSRFGGYKSVSKPLCICSLCVSMRDIQVNLLSPRFLQTPHLFCTTY